MTLQKLSNHLALLIPNSSDLSEKQERDLAFLQEMVPDRWEDLYANRESLFNLSNPEFCGKVDSLIINCCSVTNKTTVENSQKAPEVLA
jgi:hypothetical protein